MTIITHRPAVDWLTLTTYEARHRQQLAQWVKRRGLRVLRDGSAGHGYAGSFGDGWFLGQTERPNGPHFMGRFSGALADRFMFDGGRPGNLDCTRIDLQLTLPTPYKEYELYRQVQQLVDDLHEAEQQRGHRARGIDPIVPPDGEFTIYLGNRQDTHRFTRFYAKPMEDEDWLLRFEVEFKGKTGVAGKVYRHVGRAPESMVRILAGELTSWPPHPLILPFKEHLIGVPGQIMKAERTRPTPHKTLRWIARTVFPAWKKLLGHEDSRDRAAALLYELLAYAEGLDNGTDSVS